MTSHPQLHPSSRWKLFPIEANGKKPLTANGFKDASNDPAQLELWATQYPSCNWAVATGDASGVFVVDVDGAIGAASLVAMVEQGLTLPPTLTATTGRLDGGWHIYFTTPVGIALSSSTGKLGNGLDVKANGGYVVIPPSIHASGKHYTFVDPNVSIAEAPAWLLERLTSAILTIALPLYPSLIREPTERERATAAKALRSEVEQLSQTTSGRNAALNTAALHLGEMVAAGWTTRSEVEQALWGAAFTNGYRSKDGDNEAWKTLQSGIMSGLKKPREPLIDLPLAFNPDTFTVSNVPMPQPNPNDGVEIVTMSDIIAKSIEWLWNDYLPLGKLTLLAGAAGTGKSTLAFNMAATVSAGGIWPDNTRCSRPGHVVIWSSEDDVADTIVPRLKAMNADSSRIHIIASSTRGKDGKVPFSPATDIPLLKAKVIANGGISLLIIDPIVSAVTGDMNKTNEVRRGLESIVNFAQELNCAVIGITHFAKGTSGRNPADRVIGSQAFAAFARMVLVAAKDEESDKRVFTRAKSNIGLDNGGFYYGIQPMPLGNNITATRIEWGGAIEGSSREILATVEHQEGKDDSHTLTDDAKTFLVAELKNGPRPAKDLISMAHSQLGISEKTLQRARKQLGIETQKDGVYGGWMWGRPFKAIDNTRI